MRLLPHDVVVVIGQRGCGKSHFVKLNIVADCQRYIVFDPHGEYPCDERLDLDGFIDAAPRLLSQETMRVSVTPASRMPDEVTKDFCRLVEFVNESGGFVFLIDEVGILSDAGGVNHLKYLATQSRHFGEEPWIPGQPQPAPDPAHVGVPVVFLAQRAVQIPLTARNQASHVISFMQNDPEDIEALRKRIGHMADQIPKLSRAKHEKVHWREDAD
jgi:energy-coupling factor transporter ATP-binding protein EcfA2